MVKTNPSINKSDVRQCIGRWVALLSAKTLVRYLTLGLPRLLYCILKRSDIGQDCCKVPYIGQNGRMIWFIAMNQFVLNSHDLIPA